jgi:hypothetical protein
MMKKKKEATIDDLARMVAKGFNETAKQADMDRRFKDVDRRFDEVNERLDRIENFILKQHGAEIEMLKRRIQKIEETFAVK